MGSVPTPPSPPAHHHPRHPNLNIFPAPMTNKEQENSVMVYKGKCKSVTNIESLSDDLVFGILLLLPAKDLYDGAMFVCKKWCSIIRNRNFIYAHLHDSTRYDGLVIQHFQSGRHTTFLTVRQGQIEISEFDYSFKGFIFSSSNGLILECDVENNGAPYVCNPTTKQRLSLPAGNYCTGIAYASASKVYKAVKTFHRKERPGGRSCVVLLTIGVDKSWRGIVGDHLSPEARKVLGLQIPLPLFIDDGSVYWTKFPLPFSIDGFVYWTDGNGGHVVTLNVETEVVTESQVPQGYDEKLKFYLSTGSSLTFLTHINEYSWEVWEMRRETGKWTKLPNIDLEPQKDKLVKLAPIIDPSRGKCFNRNLLTPVGWLNCQEVLVLRVFPTWSCFVYNVRTREIEFVELGHGFDSDIFRLHRNSLVGFSGC